MPDEPLAHNTHNGITAAVWRRGDAVHKRLTRHGRAPAHWRPSDDPRHYNYWRREALVYATGLPARLGLGAPRLLGIERHAGGDLELRLEAVQGRTGAAMGVADLEAAAIALGRAQGAAVQPSWPWLSRGCLRTLLGARRVDHTLLTDDAAWDQPLVRRHLAPHREGILALHARREWLLGVSESLPRTVCHLDVWPHNLIRRPGGEIVVIDWAFTGDGSLGEDIGNLVPDPVFDLVQPAAALEELDARLPAAYLAGLRTAGWDGDERLIRLGICAAAVKYDWLAPLCLARAGDAAHLAYGVPSDGEALYAARGAGLGLLVRWVAEAERLAAELGLPAPMAGSSAAAATSAGVP